MLLQQLFEVVFCAAVVALVCKVEVLAESFHGFRGDPVCDVLLRDAVSHRILLYSIAASFSSSMSFSVHLLSVTGISCTMMQ